MNFTDGGGHEWTVPDAPERTLRCEKCRLHPQRQPDCKDCRIAALEQEVEHLRAAIRERECECLEGKWDARGMVPPHTCWRCRALTKPEGE